MRILPYVVAVLATAVAVGATSRAGAADPADVVFVTRDCASTDHICPGFAAAARL